MLSDKLITWRKIAKTPVGEPLPHHVRVELQEIAVQLYDLAHNREPVGDGEVQLRKRPSKRVRAPAHRPAGLTPEQVAKKVAEVVGLSRGEISAYREETKAEVWGAVFEVKAERGKYEFAAVDVSKMAGLSPRQIKRYRAKRKP